MLRDLKKVFAIWEGTTSEQFCCLSGVGRGPEADGIFRPEVTKESADMTCGFLQKATCELCR